MSDQICNKFDKKSYMTLVTYKFDEKTIEALYEIIISKTNHESVKTCLDQLEVRVGIYRAMSEQIRQAETSTEVNKIIRKTRSNVNKLINSLEELSQSDESLNRLTILMPAFSSQHEMVIFINNRDERPRPNPVSDMFNETTENLNMLVQRLNMMEEMGEKIKKIGRPRKIYLKQLVKQIYSIYNEYVGKPNLTQAGDFENFAEICLAACGEPKSDFHQLIIDSIDVLGASS